MNQKFIWLITCFLLFAGICSAQFPFYFSSGNFLPPHSWTQDSAIRMGTVANTNIQISNPTATGKCYFRFYSALGGGINYESNADTDMMIQLAAPFNLQVAPIPDYSKSFYFSTENETDNYVFKSTGSGAPGNTRCAVIRVQGPIQSVISISQYPAAIVSAAQNITITASTSDTFSPGQGAYLRYTTDYWNSSTIVQMTGSGTQYSGIIPANINADNAWVNYYVFTSGDSLSIAPADADLMTINLYNNSFQNFSYTVSCPFTLGNSAFQLLTCNKARYNPGDTVWLSSTFNDSIVSANLAVQYWHLDDSISQQNFTLNNTNQFTWFWIPPISDTTGYLAQISLVQNDIVTDSTSIGIDISSNWTKFPRYGFLSKYEYSFASDRQALFTQLNRYHLNALQFYDVNYKHHLPLEVTAGQPDTLWPDIANRQTYLETVLAYINLAHGCNMYAMNYNLLYGADYPSAVNDGVSPQWGLYSDMNHQNAISYGNFPVNWASSAILVENPADTGWQNYILANELKLFQTIPYDGWHVDQLGNQGIVYTYSGTQVNLGNSFGPFLQLAKSRLGVKVCMNAVTNYGQTSIVQAPVDILYTEVWPPYTSYNDLAHLIDTNNILSNNSLSTVLAAYMDQNASDTIGVFSTPAVLLTDAVIFASGGSHIEMGEHLLDNPYFPNNNLNMSCDLQSSLVKYYDFLVAYENLLRDSISSSPATLQSSGVQVLSPVAQTGAIWVMSTQKPNKQIFHLINLLSANTLSWNDPNNNQPAPSTLQNIPLSFRAFGYVTHLFAASPDWNNGVPVAISFAQQDSVISFTLPSLNYWSMIVADYGNAPAAINSVQDMQNITAYPNPFNDQITFRFDLNQASEINITLTDALGNRLVETDAYNLNAGSQTLTINTGNLSSGIYFWSAAISNSAANKSETQYGKLMHF